MRKRGIQIVLRGTANTTINILSCPVWPPTLSCILLQVLVPLLTPTEIVPCLSQQYLIPIDLLRWIMIRWCQILCKRAINVSKMTISASIISLSNNKTSLTSLMGATRISKTAREVKIFLFKASIMLKMLTTKTSRYTYRSLSWNHLANQ